MSPIELLPAAATSLFPLATKVRDGLSESFFGKLLSQPETEVESDGRDRAGSVASTAELLELLKPQSGRGVAHTADGRLDSFIAKLRRQLAAEGIDTSLEIELKTDGRGEVVVTGNHPDRAEIESIFASHPPLAEDFRRVAATLTARHRQQNPHEFPRRELRLRLVEGHAEARFL